MADTALMNKEEARSEATAPEPIHGGACYVPRVDILETEKELTIYADMPGCKPDDVNIKFENGHLEIHGRCQPRQENTEYLLNEYGVGDYYRAFSVGDSIDGSKITASDKQGVLIVHLPKSEAAQPKKISVKAE